MTEKNQKTVFVLHTSFALVDILGKQFKEHIPEVRIVNILDDKDLRSISVRGEFVGRLASVGRQRVRGVGRHRAAPAVAVPEGGCEAFGALRHVRLGPMLRPWRARGAT